MREYLRVQSQYQKGSTRVAVVVDPIGTHFSPSFVHTIPFRNGFRFFFFFICGGSGFSCFLFLVLVLGSVQGFNETCVVVFVLGCTRNSVLQWSYNVVGGTESSISN